MQIINELTRWHEGFDSCSPEHKMFEAEVRYYFDLIRQKIAQQISEN